MLKTAFVFLLTMYAVVPMVAQQTLALASEAITLPAVDSAAAANERQLLFADQELRVTTLLVAPGSVAVDEQWFQHLHWQFATPSRTPYTISATHAQRVAAHTESARDAQ